MTTEKKNLTIAIIFCFCFIILSSILMISYIKISVLIFIIAGAIQLLQLGIKGIDFMLSYQFIKESKDDY